MSKLVPAAVGAVFAFASIALAQNPVAMPPTYPTLTTLANLGGKPGGSVETILTGTNLKDATGVWTSFGGTVTIDPKQSDAAKLKVSIAIPAEAKLGWHSIRVATKSGISNLRPFILDDLPEVAEKDNNTKAKPQQVAAPCVAVGTASAETADFYKLSVKSGERLTIDAVARRLGSPCDPVLIVYDGTGKELPGLYADDTPGLQGDARVSHVFDKAMDIIVEVRDATYRGGGDFAYRLRIGNCPGATTAFPLAIERGKSAQIGFAGTKLDGVLPVAVTGAGEVQYAAPKRAEGHAGWPVPVRVHNHPEATEAEPNDAADKANAIAVPGGISAAFATKGDLDHFKFVPKKGAKYAITALSFELNAPTEVYVRTFDAKGVDLGKSNPQQVGVRVEITAPSDEPITIACEHTNYLFGPNEVYHLSVKPIESDFSVSLPFERFDAPSGGVALIPITGVARLNGFAGPIEVSFHDAKGELGTATIPATANPQPNAPFFLPIRIAAGMAPGPITGQIKATAKIGDKPVTKIVSTLDAVKGSLANMPSPPTEATSQVALAIVPELPLKLEATAEKAELAAGGMLKIKVKAIRGDKIDADIPLAVALPIAGLTVPVAPIAKGKSEIEFAIAAPANFAAGRYSLLLKGTIKVAGKDVAVLATPVNITVPAPPKK